MEWPVAFSMESPSMRKLVVSCEGPIRGWSFVYYIARGAR